MGDFEGCVKECDDAVARGRELRADYALVGRALARKGNALVKLGKLQEVGGGRPPAAATCHPAASRRRPLHVLQPRSGSLRAWVQGPV